MKTITYCTISMLVAVNAHEINTKSTSSIKIYQPAGLNHKTAKSKPNSKRILIK